MGQRKLVQAFKTFFQKSVSPFLSNNDQVVRQWNHLNKIISADPIDYSQIQFYLLLANKNNSNKPTTGSSNRLPQENKYRFNDFNANVGNRSNGFGVNGGVNHNVSNKRKNLVSGLQNFQKMLSFNQQKLETMVKRQGNVQSPTTTTTNGIGIRRY